jgi:DNA-binding NarL/FixJ family response regulator
MGKDIQGKRAEEGTARPRVMLVEDEFVISLALEAQLKAAGCDVLGTARDAESAIEMACELRPDVVLMDIGLPGKDGVYATQEIMARAPTQIIMVTAYGDERVERALEAGARAALVKPVVEQQLQQAIMEVSSDPTGGSAGREPREG